MKCEGNSTHYCVPPQTFSFKENEWTFRAVLNKIRVRNLKFARNLKFTTYKTLVNFMTKMILCLKLAMF